MRGHCNVGYTDAMLPLKAGMKKPKPKFPPACMQKVCTCAGPVNSDTGKPAWEGEAATGTKCKVHGSPVCLNCKTAGYFLSAGGKSCEMKLCKCQGGMAAAGTKCPKNGDKLCVGCYEGFHLAKDKKSCVLNKCYCENTQNKKVKGAVGETGKKCFMDNTMNCADPVPSQKWELVDVSVEEYNGKLKSQVLKQGFLEQLALVFGPKDRAPNAPPAERRASYSPSSPREELRSEHEDPSENSERAEIWAAVSVLQTAMQSGEGIAPALPLSVIKGLPPIRRLQALCSCKYGEDLDGVNCPTPAESCNPEACKYGYHPEFPDVKGKEVKPPFSIGPKSGKIYICRDNVCTCNKGKGAINRSCPKHGEPWCGSCDQAGKKYLLNKITYKCDPICKCQHGQKINPGNYSACPAPKEACASCFDGYHIKNPGSLTKRVCMINKCRCPPWVAKNGTKFGPKGVGTDGVDCPVHEMPYCASCKGPHFVLNTGLI